jgi:hypothetical protein
VLIDGQVVMRGGVLEADVARARALAEAARERIAPAGVVAATGGVP